MRQRTQSYPIFFDNKTDLQTFNIWKVHWSSFLIKGSLSKPIWPQSIAGQGLVMMWRPSRGSYPGRNSLNIAYREDKNIKKCPWMKAQHPCFKLKKPKCLHCAKNRTEGVCVSFYQPATCHFLKAAMTHSSIWQIKIIFRHKDTSSESKTSHSCDIYGGKNTHKN